MQSLKKNDPKLSKLFDTVQQVAPQGIGLASIALDNQNNLTVTGVARSYSMAGEFAKGLAGDNVTVGKTASSTNMPYFTNVHLSSLSASAQGSVGFSLTATMSSEVVNGSTN
jgi:hypothetical protein